jgi:hypothetical protein
MKWGLCARTVVAMKLERAVMANRHAMLFSVDLIRDSFLFFVGFLFGFLPLVLREPSGKLDRKLSHPTRVEYRGKTLIFRKIDP